MRSPVHCLVGLRSPFAESPAVDLSVKVAGIIFAWMIQQMKRQPFGRRHLGEESPGAARFYCPLVLPPSYRPRHGSSDKSITTASNG